MKRTPSQAEQGSFPFCVPSIRSLNRIDVDVPVTLFVGENGSGKSTLLEAIAVAAELPSLGVSELGADNSLLEQRRFAACLRLAWRPRSRQGFFLRAEDFFGYLRNQARTDARIDRERKEFLGLRIEQSADTIGGMHVDETNAATFLGRYDSRSHGESFLELLSSRVRPGGLYLLDEPETPMSPKKQLLLLGLVMRAATAGAQFVIATHSPILLACPGARLLTFDDPPIREMRWDRLEHVTVMRSFLEDPEEYLRGLRERLAP